MQHSIGTYEEDIFLLNTGCVAFEIQQPAVITTLSFIKYEREHFITFSNTEIKIENTKHNGGFLTNFEVFKNVIKHFLKCLMYLPNQT